MKKKLDQAKLNKVLMAVVWLLALYSIALTWWGIGTYMDTKRSLEFLYSNVEFRNPSQ